MLAMSVAENKGAGAYGVCRTKYERLSALSKQLFRVPTTRHILRPQSSPSSAPTNHAASV